MAEVVKTIENVDELFSQIVVNGETHVSERYVPHTLPASFTSSRQSAVNNPQSSLNQNQPVEPVQGEDVYAVELNNILHDFDDRELALELQEEATARSNADTSLRNDLDAEILARQNADNTLQGNIDSEASSRQSADTTLQGNINAEATARSNADNTLQGEIITNAGNITTINSKIPSQATTQNQLADKNFVNSSIATNTAHFLGTYTSMAQIEAIADPTNNDYAFLQSTDSAGNTIYSRYKYNSTTSQWEFEYQLNNTGFTAEQWATINSGLTSTSISDAIGALDVASVGGNGKYIKSISQVDGKIVPVEDDLSSVGGGLAFIGTRAQYDVAKLIPVGTAGHIPSGVMVKITDEDDYVEGETR